MAAANPIRFQASFKSASELRNYLVRHPGAVHALQTRKVWHSTEERNPLLMIGCTNLAASQQHGINGFLSVETLVDMAKILLVEFQANPMARHGPTAWNGDSTEKMQIELCVRYSDADEPLWSQYNTAFQVFAANAAPDQTQMVALILEAGADHDEKAIFCGNYHVRSYGYNYPYNSQVAVNALELLRHIGVLPEETLRKLIDDHMKKTAQKGAITSLTDRVRQLPKLQQSLAASKRVAKTMQQREAAYKDKMAESAALKANLQAKIKKLEAEEKAFEDAYYKYKAEAIENGDYVCPARLSALEGEIMEVTDLMAAIQFVAAKKDEGADEHGCLERPV